MASARLARLAGLAALGAEALRALCGREASAQDVANGAWAAARLRERRLATKLLHKRAFHSFGPIVAGQKRGGRV